MGNRVETQIVPPDRAVSPTLVLFLAAAAFGMSISAPFTFDDFAIFTAEPVTRPLTWLTFRWNGQSPSLFHAVNLLLHFTAVWLCGDALKRVLPAGPAAMATLVFALHPIQAEAVNYVWARATLLMAVFCLLSVRDWLRGRQWLAVLWCALALAAKEEAVALPVFLALLHLSISRNFGEWKQIGAMSLLAGAAGLYTLRAANSVAGSQASAQSVYSASEYLASEGLAILRYLQLVVVPFGFTVDADIPVGWWGAWIVIAGLAGFAITRFNKAQWGFWVIAALALLLPTSSIFPANDLAADRRMYLPMFALSAGIALVLPRRVGVVLAILLTVLSTYRTWVWSDNARLWSEAVEHAPSKLRPRVQLARALPPADAIPVLNKAKEIAPNDAAVASELGRTYLALNRPADALQEFGRTLALAPGSAEAMSNRGVALAMLKQDAAARADFERALSVDSCSFEARLNLKRLGVPTPLPPNCRYTPEQRAALQ